MNPSTLQIFGAAVFAIAVLHTFTVKRFQHLACRFPDGSVGENFFHLLGEVEIVFGWWAGVLLVGMAIAQGSSATIHYLHGLDFTEPCFVFVIMAVAGTRPLIGFANGVIAAVARRLPLPSEAAFILSALILGPLLGSFITEPAAMTVTALILKERLFESKVSNRLKYLALGTLFVNVSIGGVLTPFAAPPVLMVAKIWGWDIHHMVTYFGWKSALAVVFNGLFLLIVGWKEFSGLKPVSKGKKTPRTPLWVTALHLGSLVLIVLSAHHMVLFLGIFLFCLGVFNVTREYQDEIKLRESLLVAAFLAGLVVLGSLQSWWLQPLLAKLSEVPLFLGAAALTAITDNAALTFLGAQVEGLTEALKYALVAGAVAGGGLTVIANAPNPAGYSILSPSFGKEGVSPMGLFLGALIPTGVAILAFWFLPHISI